MGSLPNRRASISWSNQKSDNWAHSQVIEVVADEGRFGHVDPEFLLQPKQCLRFVFDAHETLLDSQLACPHLGSAPVSSAEECNLDSCLLQQANTETVPDIKPFDQLSVGIKPEASIREYAIYIQHKQLDASQLIT
jgi:hypothetical protein